MASDDFDSKNDDLMHFARYRWEFVRRDEEYKKAYQAALIFRGKAKEGPIDELTGLLVHDGYFDTPEYHQEMELSRYFLSLYPGILLNPSLSFDDIRELFRNSTRFLPPLENSRAWASFCVGIVDSCVSISFHMDGLPQPIAPKEGEFIIKIDLHRLNSISRLKKNVTSIVDKMCDQFSLRPDVFGFDPEKQDKTSRTRLDLVLEAGDRRFVDGKSYGQIAMELEPQDFKLSNDNAKPESKTKMAKYYCDQYHEMVRGGWKALRYP